jgi:tetratricopeptide (TPR) repeat protein
MDINIRQYASNQGVSVHVNGKKNVTINEINESGVTPLLAPRKKGVLHFMANMLKKKKFLKYTAFVSVFLVAGSISFLLLNRGPLEDRLYKRYYEPYVGSIVLSDNTAFNEATKRYEQGDAVAALLIMKNLPDNYSIKKELIFYKALSSMDMGNFDEAIQCFDTISILPDNQTLKAKAKWYQGLCYLKTNNITSAKRSFSCISSIFPKEYKKAQKIINRLEKHSGTKH